jgi:hypothetical protein
MHIDLLTARLPALPATPTLCRSLPACLSCLPAEDRICGTIDIEKALTEGVKAYEPGLLAKANRGILYVDEVNLLDDGLVDVVLDSGGCSGGERRVLGIGWVCVYLTGRGGVLWAPVSALHSCWQLRAAHVAAALP